MSKLLVKNNDNNKFLSTSWRKENHNFYLIFRIKGLNFSFFSFFKFSFFTLGSWPGLLPGQCMSLWCIGPYSPSHASLAASTHQNSISLDGLGQLQDRVNKQRKEWSIILESRMKQTAFSGVWEISVAGNGGPNDDISCFRIIPTR